MAHTVTTFKRERVKYLLVYIHDTVVLNHLGQHAILRIAQITKCDLAVVFFSLSLLLLLFPYVHLFFLFFFSFHVSAQHAYAVKVLLCFDPAQNI